MTEVDQIIHGIIEREGVFVDHPEDKGGPTKYGVTWRSYDAWRNAYNQANPEDGLTYPEDVRDITQEIAAKVYLADYVVGPRFPKVANGPLLELLVDTAVHSGPGQAVKFLQRAVGTRDDGIIGPKTIAAARKANPRQTYVNVLDRRLRFIGEITQGNPGNLSFLPGWQSRMGYFVWRCLDI